MLSVKLRSAEPSVHGFPTEVGHIYCGYAHMEIAKIYLIVATSAQMACACSAMQAAILYVEAKTMNYKWCVGDMHQMIYNS